MAVGIYSLYNAAAIGLSPDLYVETPSHVLVFSYCPRWVLAVIHLVLAVALFGSLAKTFRLSVAMLTCALYFLFWAGVAVVPALFGLIEVGNSLGLGAYLFAACYAGYWGIRMLCVGGGEGHDAG